MTLTTPWRALSRAACASAAAAAVVSVAAKTAKKKPTVPSSQFRREIAMKMPPGCAVFRASSAANSGRNGEHSDGGSVGSEENTGGVVPEMLPSSTEELCESVRGADVVLFGEVHDDEACHAIETQLYAFMLQNTNRTHERNGGANTEPMTGGGRCILSLEMLERGIEPALTRFMKDDGGAPVSVDELLVGWSNFADYAELLHAARDSGSPIVAANPPRPAVSLVYREGLEALNDLGAEAKALLPPLPLAAPSLKSRAKLEAVFAEVVTAREGESAEARELRISRLVDAQNLWDAGQAHSVASAVAAEPELRLLHVCGAKHVEGRLGVPEHIARLQPHLNVLVIMTIPGNSDHHDAIAAETPLRPVADFMIVTPTAVQTRPTR